MADRSVEIALNINPAGAIDGLDQAARKAEETKRRLDSLTGDVGSFDPKVGRC